MKADMTSFWSRSRQRSPEDPLFISDGETGNCCNWSEAARALPVIGRQAANVYVALVALRRLSARFLGSGNMMGLKMQSILGAFLFLNVCCSLVSALYFHIGETEKKCFIEEIPDETMIIGQYVKGTISVFRGEG